MSKSWGHALLFTSLAGALASCSTVPDQPQPVAVRPSADLTRSADLNSDDVVPQAEPPSRSGNPDTYVVFGKRYRVKETSAGHREIGTASWYGWDFHGRRTSSGPPFNMFELTAAHKSLPLPTYARVTNLDNGRSIVVKVNDRGPFVGERIIDLSYAAAARLDMLDRGTARVEVTALAPYQFLPTLAARRAEARERQASRVAELISQQEEVAALHFAQEKRVAERTSAKPPVVVQDQALRLARNTSPVKENRRNSSATKLQLASAAPVVKAKPVAKGNETARGKLAPKTARKTAESRVASASKSSALYVVGTVTERNSARQVQNRLSSQMQRNVQVESGAGKQYEVRVPLRNPGEARQVTMRLASLGVSRSRIVAD